MVPLDLLVVVVEVSVGFAVPAGPWPLSLLLILAALISARVLPGACPGLSVPV